MESLKEKTAKGLFWGGMNNGVQQLLGLAFGIILGRLLDPSDYGMTAMLAVFSVIANELQASGFKTGLINMKAPTHRLLLTTTITPYFGSTSLQVPSSM